jgi:NAD(P)-dependent dehydrogenase (short-subunit alcohol dehydrogenase family)
MKAAFIGLTRYLAIYWADKEVRVNANCPGGVQADQPDEFLEKVTFRIPMGRMARKDEHKGAILFLVSDASSYMTGATLIIDGGRTCW